MAAWLAGFMLLVQLVTAAYACPRSEDRSDTAALAAELMHECDGDMHGAMDPEQPQLCKAHCDQGTQSVNLQASPEFHASPAALPVLLWVLPLLAEPPSVMALSKAPTEGPPRGSPPLYLSLLSLRN